MPPAEEEEKPNVYGADCHLDGTLIRRPRTCSTFWDTLPVPSGRVPVVPRLPGAFWRVVLPRIMVPKSRGLCKSYKYAAGAVSIGNRDRGRC